MAKNEIVNDQTEEVSSENVADDSAVKQSRPKNSFVSKLQALISTKKRKVVAGVLAVVVIVSALSAIPTTRYAIAGTVIKKQVTVKVIDQTTNDKISEATVTIGNWSAKTDKEGVATLSKIPVGDYTVRVEKKYYKPTSFSQRVGILSSVSNGSTKIVATGRQVEVVVTDAVTKQPVDKATLEFSGSSATTDSDGKATLVLPAKAEAYEGKVKAPSFNEKTISIVVKDQAGQKADFQISPSGTVYYLSKRTGKINVVKSNLDGSNPQIVVQGTGNEEDGGTVLLAARDWANLALLSRREGTKPKLYVVNTASGELKTVDEGNATFELVGWSGKSFIYKVVRDTTNTWANKRIALKAYNAETGKLSTLDETYGEGTYYWDYRYENMYFVYILKDQLAYIKDWSLGSMYDYTPQDKKSALMTVNADGSAKKRVKEFDAVVGNSLNSRLYTPDELYIQFSQNGKSTYFEYGDGKVSSASDVTDAKFNNYYATYLVSPSGEKTFWYEPRDGKNTLFIGDSKGLNSKEVASMSEFKPYGWLTDKYLLLSKNDSELYVFSSGQKIDEQHTPLKITDYHKPQYRYEGYGYGYGGL